MEFYTARQLAELWGLTPRSVQLMCAKGSLPGAFRFGREWAIPKDCARPADGRRRGERCA